MIMKIKMSLQRKKPFRIGLGPRSFLGGRGEKKIGQVGEGSDLQDA